jgi:hypothetical protein
MGLEVRHVGDGCSKLFEATLFDCKPAASSANFMSLAGESAEQRAVGKAAYLL